MRIEFLCSLMKYSKACWIALISLLNPNFCLCSRFYINVVVIFKFLHLLPVPSRWLDVVNQYDYFNHYHNLLPCYPPFHFPVHCAHQYFPFKLVAKNMNMVVFLVWQLKLSMGLYVKGFFFVYVMVFFLIPAGSVCMFYFPEYLKFLYVIL